MEKMLPSKILAMTKLFEMVQNKKHWKMSIDAWVPKETDMPLLAEAIAYFTGSEAIIGETNDMGLTQVQADGYYSAVGIGSSAYEKV